MEPLSFVENTGRRNTVELMCSTDPKEDPFQIHRLKEKGMIIEPDYRSLLAANIRRVNADDLVVFKTFITTWYELECRLWV